MSLAVGSLFSGIGGLDLGLERAGMNVIWQSEIDPYASRVLAKHWPHVPNLGDIATIDWSTVEPPDVICGGYPCQPFSLAGARRGEQDPRHLWPHFHRAIRLLRPRYALLENVPGHLSMGLDRVLGDLAEIRYDVEWASVPAAAMGAPDLRWRLFAVAHHQRDELRQQPESIFRSSGTAVARDDGAPRDVADTPSPPIGGRSHEGSKVRGRHVVEHVAVTGDGCGPINGGEQQCSDGSDGADAGAITGGQDSTWTTAHADGAPRRATLNTEPASSQGTVGSGHPGLGGCGVTPGRSWWAVEPDVGRVAHGIPARVDRLRTLGNAVVPQVAEYVGRMIVEAAA